MHLDRRTVLVVDDDRETRHAFADWLSDAGYSCITVADALTALWYARRLSPVAAVIDIGRHHERLRVAGSLMQGSSPIGIVFTFSARAARRLPSLPFNMSCHLVKPCTSADLVAAVERARLMLGETPRSPRSGWSGTEFTCS